MSNEVAGHFSSDFDSDEFGASRLCIARQARVLGLGTQASRVATTTVGT
jgi:hypothetical protein